MKIHLIAKAFGLEAGAYIILKFGMPLITSPLPSSVIFMYMTLVTISIVLYVSIYEDDFNTFFLPIVAFIRGSQDDKPRRKFSRATIFVLIPLFFGFRSYQDIQPNFEPPFPQRVIHPAPPGSAAGFINPYGDDESHREEYIQEGRRVFYENCVFCHGDKLDGKGFFAEALNVKPANFADATTISMLQESFVFWRVKTGGIGLPEESTPWDSAMPRWELILTEEERWKVIMFLYDYTGFKPRTWELGSDE
ncbi:MAG: c-type cytochrome [Nitrospiria bacterium]